MKEILEPDGFAVSLAVLGAILVFMPLMVMLGVIAILLAAAYWSIMTLVKAVHRRRGRL